MVETLKIETSIFFFHALSKLSDAAGAEQLDINISMEKPELVVKVERIYLSLEGAEVSAFLQVRFPPRMNAAFTPHKRSPRH